MVSQLNNKHSRVSTILIGHPIHAALCHNLVKILMNYYFEISVD